MIIAQLTRHLKKVVEQEQGFIGQAGNCAYLIPYCVLAGMGQGMRKYIKQVFIPDMVLWKKGAQGKVYYSRRETRQIARFYLRESLKGNGKFKAIQYRRFLNILEKIERLSNRLRRLELENQSELFIQSQLRQLSVLFSEGWAYGFFVEAYDEDGRKLIYDYLIQHNLKLTERELQILLLADYSSYISNYQQEVLAWKLKPTAAKRRYLLAKYYFVKADYLEAPALTARQLSAEVFHQGKKRIQSRLKQIKRTRQESKKVSGRRPAIISRHKLTKEAVRLFDFFAGLVKWRDERKKLTQIASCTLWRLVAELARRVNFKQEFLPYIILPEIADGFYKTAGYSQILANRKRHSLFYLNQQGETFWLYNSQKIDQIKKLLDQNIQVGLKEFRGEVANRGCVRGLVKVIDSKADFSKLKKGEIIVASMTRPEYMPILGKAAAIVTDEGGVSCHAAIVARELDIPCLVGTKIATKVLKDGQVVEVNANQGVITIIK